MHYIYNDKKFNAFIGYVKCFYGTEFGLYKEDYHGGFSDDFIAKSLDLYLSLNPKFEGDTIDREHLADIMRDAQDSMTRKPGTVWDGSSWVAVA